MAAMGFKLKKSQERFVRVNGPAEEWLAMVFISDPPGYRIKPDLAVRFPIVEDLFHRTSGNPPKTQSGTCTFAEHMGVSMGPEHRHMEFRLSSLSDVTPVAEQLLMIFQSFSARFFDRVNTLEGIDRLFNEKNSRPDGERVLSRLSCSRGIIVAKLLGRENYAALEAMYREHMAVSDGGFYRKSFEGLLEILATVRPLAGQPAVE